MGHCRDVEQNSQKLRRLTTRAPRHWPGVLFAVLVRRGHLPDPLLAARRCAARIQWLEAGSSGKIRLSEIMPFAGICFLWFIGVVRANMGRYGTVSSPP